VGSPFSFFVPSKSAEVKEKTKEAWLLEFRTFWASLGFEHLLMEDLTGDGDNDIGLRKSTLYLESF